MPNIWRRQPTARIAAKDLIRQRAIDARQSIVVAFFEVSVAPPRRSLMGVGR